MLDSKGKEISKCKTAVCRGQPNPTYKETFAFQVALFQLSEVSLVLTVFSRSSSLRPRERLGWVSLGFNSSSEEQKAHWAEMKEAKGQQVCHWHTLTDTTGWRFLETDVYISIRLCVCVGYRYEDSIHDHAAWLPCHFPVMHMVFIGLNSRKNQLQYNHQTYPELKKRLCFVLSSACTTVYTSRHVFEPKSLGQQSPLGFSYYQQTRHFRTSIGQGNKELLRTYNILPPPPPLFQFLKFFTFHEQFLNFCYTKVFFKLQFRLSQYTVHLTPFFMQEWICLVFISLLFYMPLVSNNSFPSCVIQTQLRSFMYKHGASCWGGICS